MCVCVWRVGNFQESWMKFDFRVCEETKMIVWYEKFEKEVFRFTLWYKKEYMLKNTHWRLKKHKYKTSMIDFILVFYCFLSVISVLLSPFTKKPMDDSPHLQADVSPPRSHHISTPGRHNDEGISPSLLGTGWAPREGFGERGPSHLLVCIAGAIVGHEFN